MAVTNLTNDQWAILKGYTQFLAAAGPDPPAGSGFLDGNDYPTAAALDLFRSRANGLIKTCARGTPTLDSDYLMDLEFRMVELMMDEEQGRETEDGRPIYIPRDYMYERDRQKVASSGSTGFTRGIGS
jgi:hypothetical protein